VFVLEVSVEKYSRVPSLRGNLWVLNLLCLTILVTGAFAGELVLVDRIVAIVDEEAILQSDVDREVELFKMEKEYAGQVVTGSPEEVRREMLERLMESKLIIAAAKQADMTVDEEAIEASVQDKIDQFVEHFGSMETLQMELARSGMTLSDYRARMSTQLRDQQYLRLVVGKFIRPNLEVMDNEVRDYYLEHLSEMPAEPDSLTLSNILIPVQPSLAVRQEIQNQIELVLQELAQGTSFDSLARQYSKGPNASRGGAVGVVGPGDLFDPSLDRAVFSLPVGQVSDPVISSRGVHLLLVNSVQSDGKRALSQIFMPIEVSEEDMRMAEEQINLARQRVLSGESFERVAAEVSADAVSAGKGGLLGTFSLTDLSTQFQEVLKDQEVGVVTEPLLTPAGWYVFLIHDRVDGHMYTYEELEDNLRQVVEGEKIEAALAEYVKGLKERFFIDEKI
jgi:peptidyl-prolyl cis-trans isomerase SurA